jgi:hypothetical protein
MKRLSLFAATLIAADPGLMAQTTTSLPTTGRVHQGFHLTVGLGPVFGHIHDRVTGQLSPGVNGTEEVQYKGTGFGLDLRIGGSVSEHLVLTGDIVSRVISAPQISYNGTDYNTTTDLTIGEVTYGAGLTYFIMPANISLGATLGTGVYTITNTGEDGTTGRTDFGFSGVARVGKTWWLGRSINMGIGLSYSYTEAPNNEAGLKETLFGDRLMATALFMVH